MSHFFLSTGIALFFLFKDVHSQDATAICAGTCDLFTPSTPLDSEGCITAPVPPEGLTATGDLLTDEMGTVGKVDVFFSADSKLTLSVTADEGFCIEDIRYAVFPPPTDGICDLDAIPDNQEVYYASFGDWCSGEMNVFEVKLPSATAGPPLCVAVLTNLVNDTCKDSDCIGPEPFECEDPESSKSSKSKSKSKSSSSSTCGAGKSNTFCEETCATSFIKLESPKYCIILSTAVNLTATKSGAGARWKRADNGGSLDSFYVGTGDLGNGNCRVNTGVSYIYTSLMPLEVEYIGGANDLFAKITAGVPKNLTADLDGFVNCAAKGTTSDMWNTLKIQLANRGSTKTGVVRFTNVKFNDVELGDFCVPPSNDIKDFYFDLAGYDFAQGATVTGNLVLCGTNNTFFDGNEFDKVEIDFVDVVLNNP